MKLKKFCALIMALAMTLALTVPAMANSAATRTIPIAGDNKVGTIDVQLETASDIILNPYQMEATVSGGTTGSYHQIYFVPVKCINKSDFGLKVNAVIKGTASSGVEFASTAPKDTATEKQVFLYAEFGTSSKASQQPAWASGYDKSNASQVLISSDDSASKTVATLTAASSAKPNYLWYKFDGSATKSPTNAWAAADKVSANIVLTFVPTVDAVYPITVVNTTSKTAAGTVALNYDLAPAGKTITVTCTADNEVNGNATATVTAMQGTTKITVDPSDNSFTMPAGDVTVTVKWTAPSA